MPSSDYLNALWVDLKTEAVNGDGDVLQGFPGCSDAIEETDDQSHGQNASANAVRCFAWI